MIPFPGARLRVLGWIELRFRVLVALPRRDPARLWLRWARQAHHGDVVRAMAALGEALRTGHGVRRDAQEAEAWARAARA